MPRASEIEVNNNVLKWARQEAGLTLNAAAETLGIQEETLARLEQGDSFPSRTLLRKMSRAYRRPYAVLLMPEPPETIVRPTDYRTLPGSDERPFGPALANALKEANKYQELMSDIVTDAPNLFPSFQIPFSIPDSIADTDFESTGEKIRGYLGVSSQTIRQWPNTERAFRHWRLRFQSVGILVLIEDIPREEARGLSLWGVGLVPTIVITKNEHWSAQIFTLFHELAHILRRSSAVCLKEESDSELGRLELWCNSVAAATLVPANELYYQVELRGHNGHQRFWELDELAELSSFFRVSRHVIAIRLQELSLAPRRYYDVIKHQLSIDDIPPPPREITDTENFRRNIPNERLSEIGSIAASAIVSACRNSILTTPETATLLRMRPRSFERFEKLAREQTVRYG